MAEIHVLSSETINKIAAGEVVEKPVNVVKELAENSLDAGASAVTIEIKDGGISMIRVTDNGCGIDASQITKAFRRHATSKIEDSDDLARLHSLGFRGEALSSIAAVSQVEMITKTADALSGIRATNAVYPGRSRTGSDSNFYGGAEAAAGPDADAGAASLQTTDMIPLELEEVGAPDGTTVIVRDLFYNVPVRKKFLKMPQTEAGYVTDLVEKLALSHPDVSFHYIVNRQEKLHTTGNGNEKELIYRIFGREMANSVIPIDVSGQAEDASGHGGEGKIVFDDAKDSERKGAAKFRIQGYLGRPEFSRSSRSFEIIFVNGRILKSDVLSKALEEGYRTDLMQHRFPFAILYLAIPAAECDVNVHPSKMEVRFSNAKPLYDFVNEAVHRTLHKVELIPHATLMTQAEENAAARKETKEREAALKSEKPREVFEKGTADAVQTAESFSDRGGVQTEEFTFTDLRPEDKPKDAVAAGHGKSVVSDAAGLARYEQAAEEEASLRNTDSAGNAAGVKKSLRADALNAAAAPEEKGHYEQAALFAQEHLATPEEAEAAEQARRDDALMAYIRERESRDRAEGLGSYSLTERILTKENALSYRIVGQIFDTYWIIEYEDKMLMIDQHAAHEKVNFERLMVRLAKSMQGPAASQMVAPPIILNLTGKEEAAYVQYRDYFHRMGYEIEDFGDGSYAIRGVPMELYANEPDALIREVLDEILVQKMSGTPAAILYKIASMSCKAAVKGNMRLSTAEAKALIDELLTLDNPYHCPHGRPTMIVLSKAEVEKKFKRIV